MSKDKLQYDVIVVGAGMAGSTAAAIAAREGLNVAVIERGVKPGSKNDAVHIKLGIFCGSLCRPFRKNGFRLCRH